VATTWAKYSARSVVSTQTTTEAAPTGGSEGLDLESVAGFTIHFACDVGETFTSAASVFEAYRYNSRTGIWSRSAEHDVTVGAEGLGKRAFAVSYQVASPRDRVAHVANAVSVSGGGLTLDYRCSQLNGTDC